MVTNQDNGNIKGFDFTLDKRFSKYFGIRGTYSLLFARTLQSDPLEYVETLARQLDPFTNQSPPPPADYNPTDDDRTHQISLMLRTQFPRDFRKETILGKVISEFGATFNIRYATGVPYTPIDKRVISLPGPMLPAPPVSRWRICGSPRISSSDRIGLPFMPRFSTCSKMSISASRALIQPQARSASINIPGGNHWRRSETVIRTESQLIRDFNKDGFVSKSEAAAASFAKGRAQDFIPSPSGSAPRQIRLGVDYSF